MSMVVGYPMTSYFFRKPLLGTLSMYEFILGKTETFIACRKMYFLKINKNCFS